MNEQPNITDVSDPGRRQDLHKLLSEMLINISDQMFTGRSIYIDGYRFINCTFINCSLHILRGTFEFHHCLITNSDRVWNEEGVKCIQFFTHGTPLADGIHDSLKSIVYDDGTFSIAKGSSL